MTGGVPKLRGGAGTGVDGLMGAADPDPEHVATAGLVNKYRIIAELAAIGFADPAEVFDPDGRLLPIEKMPPRIRRSIQSIEVVVDAVGISTAKIKFWPKPQALETLAKAIGLITNSMKHELAPDAAELLALARESRERAALPYTPPRPDPL